MDAEFLCSLIARAEVELNRNGYNAHSAGQKFGVTTVDFDLLFTVSGSYSCLIGERSYPCAPGEILLVTPGDRVSCLADTDSRQIFCHFRLLNRDLQQLVFRTEDHRLRHPEDYAPLIRRQYALYRREGAAAPWKALLRLMAAELLLQNRVDARAFAGANPTVMPPLLMELLVWLNNNAQERVSVRELARRMNMDESYFARYFARHVGMPPVRYMGKLKMEAARAMLLQTDLSVQEIAERLGYANAFVLSKKFRAWFGQSPLPYRKTLNGSGETPLL